MADNSDDSACLDQIRPGSIAEPSSPCLDTDDILAFAQGCLSPAQMDQVHAHVDGCECCQRLVAEAAHALDAELPYETSYPPWNTVLQVNAIVARRYRIVRLVGRGGMGEVYEAFDTELQERLALKTVTSTACDNARAVRALKAEVQLARRISHPNVCRIYDFCSHFVQHSNTVVSFIAMEFVDGECLGRKLRECGALPMEEAQSIARQLLYGLRAAHQAGILHRDFKSDNVVLRQHGNESAVPVILDFGLAKPLNETGTVSSTLNRGQTMVGTIGYMSPEQLEGEPLSQASDIYSFGIVWYEMLTGRLPFEGQTPVAAAMARLRVHAVPPSRCAPHVPKWIDQIVLRCLRRSREERYSSAEQVLQALTHLDPVGAVSQTPPRRGNGALLASSAVLGGALLASVAMRSHPTLPVRAVPVRSSIAAAVPPMPELPEPSAACAVSDASDVTALRVPTVSLSPPTDDDASARATASARRTTKRRSKSPTGVASPPEASVSESVSGSAAEPRASKIPDWLPP